MIVAYLLVTGYWISPPLADMDSCQRLKEARDSTSAKCVQVVIPTPSREAYITMPNKIAK